LVELNCSFLLYYGIGVYEMKKIVFSLLLALSTTIFVGCSGDTAPTPSQTTSSSIVSTISVTVTLSVDGKQKDSKKLTVTEGEDLLTAIKSSFSIEETDGFITSIDGNTQDEAAGKYWLFTVNGEMSPVGAKEVVLKQGDKIVFTLDKIS
jgi:hypothetical protein